MKSNAREIKRNTRYPHAPEFQTFIAKGFLRVCYGDKTLVKPRLVAQDESVRVDGL
jgi:hypothetical protein